MWCLGVDIDPLSLHPSIHTVAVFDAPAFDRIFDGLVAQNEEGTIISGSRRTDMVGLPFRPDAVRHLTSRPNMHTVRTTLLHQAWKHHATLLNHT